MVRTFLTVLITLKGNIHRKDEALKFGRAMYTLESSFKLKCQSPNLENKAQSIVLALAICYGGGESINHLLEVILVVNILVCGFILKS